MLARLMRTNWITKKTTTKKSFFFCFFALFFYQPLWWVRTYKMMYLSSQHHHIEKIVIRESFKMISTSQYLSDLTFKQALAKYIVSLPFSENNKLFQHIQRFRTKTKKKTIDKQNIASNSIKRNHHTYPPISISICDFIFKEIYWFMCKFFFFFIQTIHIGCNKPNKSHCAIFNDDDAAAKSTWVHLTGWRLIFFYFKQFNFMCNHVKKKKRNEKISNGEFYDFRSLMMKSKSNSLTYAEAFLFFMKNENSILYCHDFGKGVKRGDIFYGSKGEEKTISLILSDI